MSLKEGGVGCEEAQPETFFNQGAIVGQSCGQYIIQTFRPHKPGKAKMTPSKLSLTGNLDALTLALKMKDE